MNPKERELHYPLGDALPAPGATLEVAPGVRWLRMALPFALDHINLWLLRDRHRRPRGLDHRRLRHHATTPRARPGSRCSRRSCDGLPVLRVIVTHMHPDHIGLAHWLPSAGTAGCGSAPPTTTPRAWRARAPPASAASAAAAFFASAWPDRSRRRSRRCGRARTTTPAWCRRCRARFRRLLDGMRVRIGGHAWHCIAGYGHAPEHIALHCADAGRADLRRHGAAAHLDQRQRLRPRARGQPAAAVPRLDRAASRRCRPTRWCCRRTASLSAACTRASSQLQRAPRRAPGRRDGGLRRGAAHRRRSAAGAVQAPARPAPDHLRDGRGDRPPARCCGAPRRPPADAEAKRGARLAWLRASRFPPSPASGRAAARCEGLRHLRGVGACAAHPTSNAGNSSSLSVPAHAARSRAAPSAPRPRTLRCGSSRAGAPVRAPRRSRSSASRSGPGASSAGSSRRRSALPQRVVAELSDSRVMRTPSRGAKSRQRSSNTRRAWRCSQLCTASRICSGVGVCGRPTCSVSRGTPGSASARCAAPRRWPRGSSTTITVSPRKGKRGAVAPLDARRLQPARALVLLLQLAQDPARLLAAAPRRSRPARPSAAR